MLTKLFNLQRRAEASAETGHATCYHCGKAKHADDSVFCAECFPEPGALPAILDERPAPQRASRLHGLLSFLIRPIRHAENVTKRLLACQQEKIDLEQSNLALRRQCADLKAQRNAALEHMDAVLREDEVIRQALTQVRAERDKATLDLRSMTAMWNERTRDRDALRVELRRLKAPTKSTEASKN